VNYEFDTGAGTYSVYGAINNLLDKNPGDVLGLDNIYGNMGRSYTVGMRFSF